MKRFSMQPKRYTGTSSYIINKNPRKLSCKALTNNSILPSIFVSSVASIIITTNSNINHIPSYEKIYNNVSSSVVSVISYELQHDPFSPNDLIEVALGAGTGFFFIDDHHIVTNAHVIDGAMAIKVKLNEDNIIYATLIGVDNEHDIAVLEMKNNNNNGDTPPNNKVINRTAPLISCNTSSYIGQPVLALGSPFGFEKSMSAGIVSGLDRVLDHGAGQTTHGSQFLLHLLQTDAAINPGNSGGPLLDGNTGCILGMNTAIASASGSSSGLGFAIPIDTVSTIAQNFIRNTPDMYEQQTSFRLGITMLPDLYANALGVHGVIIADIKPDSIASRLGLSGTHRNEQGKPMIGDVIIEVNGHYITKQSDLMNQLSLVCIGDIVHIKTINDLGEVVHTFIA